MDRIGDQTGGRVAFFLETDDFRRDHAAMTAKGVAFKETPRDEPYGTVAVFRRPLRQSVGPDPARLTGLAIHRRARLLAVAFRACPAYIAISAAPIV